MIISKANLQCSGILKHDKIPVLNNLVVEDDGTTVASNGKSIMIVGPVSDAVKKNFPLKEKSSTPERIIFGEETAKEVLKNIPRDTKFSGILEHCSVDVDDDDEEKINFTLTDGKRQRYIVGKRWTRRYIEYEKTLKMAFGSKTTSRVALNLRRLISLLECIDKACPDTSGSTPVYLEFTTDNDVMIRAQNQANGQRILALMQSYKGAEGKWLEVNEWEKSLTNRGEQYAGNDSGDDISAPDNGADVSQPLVPNLKANQENKPGALARKIPKSSR